VTAARFDPAGPLRGALTPPPDKSISHRAAILAAMGDGEATIENYLDAADTRSTLRAIETLGATVAIGGGEEMEVRIQGIGLRGPGERAARGDAPEIDVGNAGTLMRLLPGWLAGQGAGAWRLDGDESIRLRPVDRVAEPLRQMGAQLECRDGRLPPLWVHGGTLSGTTYELPVASAQVKSCVLLAGLLADGATTVVEPAPTRDHTERMLTAAGARLRVEPARTPIAIRGTLPGGRITLEPAERLEIGSVSVPGDFSSAAFAIVAAVVVPRSEITVTDLGINPTRVGLLGILNRMGAGIEVTEETPVGGEPRGSVSARHGLPLEGIRVGAGDVPLAIDELPLVALLGCFAEGRTHLSGAEELRHKESDRITTVVEGLRELGAEIEGTGDGFVVEGTGGLQGGAIDSHGDHRLAMLGAIAGLGSREGVEVRGFDAAGVSYPGFEGDLRSLLS
jgi:3-phosphoshikimate 1-carboxyvinyltransferase